MSIYYATQTWANGAAGNTPVTADALTHVETGLGSAHDRIDALTVGTVLIPTSIRTTTVAPAAGQLVTYDASSASIGPITLPVPQAGVIMGVVKGDNSTNTITFTSGTLLGNGGSTSIILRTVGESRTLYGSAGGWYVLGLHSPVVGTTAGTVAAGDDSRFANTLAAALYGGPTRTKAPACEVRTTGTFTVGSAADVYAAGGWTAAVDTDSMLGVAGGLACINIPVNGRYQFQYSVSSVVNANADVNCRITRNAANFGSSIASDARRANAGDVIGLTATDNGVLAQGDQVYWGNFCSLGTQTVYGVPSNLAPTKMTVRYVGPF